MPSPKTVGSVSLGSEAPRATTPGKSKAARSYAIQISNSGTEPIKIDVTLGEDPYLSGNCNASYGIKCDTVQVAIGFVVIGIVAFIVGILIGVMDFRKENKIRKNRKYDKK